MLISALHLDQSMLNKRSGVFYLSLKHESQLQSQTKIVGTLDQTLFFSFSCSRPLVPLKVVYPGSVTKPCTQTLREQGDTKGSQQF